MTEHPAAPTTPVWRREHKTVRGHTRSRPPTGYDSWADYDADVADAARSTPAEALDNDDERYLRLREVSELLDLPAWHDDSRAARMGVDEVQGARWLASWLGVKIAALDWLLRSTPAETLDPRKRKHRGRTEGYRRRSPCFASTLTSRR